MADIAQLVRAPGCGLGGRGFNSRYPPHLKFLIHAPVAQLDRVTGYELGGRGSESLRAHQKTGLLRKAVRFFHAILDGQRKWERSSCGRPVQPRASACAMREANF